ncbi:MAG: hypothetical protein M3370_06150, partial [Actinomycetota bacterium]|nr:hypothetical protein [Actinomycetota bacterium]
RTGCTDTPPGPESESNPGCIYAAAFAGCMNGLKPGSIPTGREGDFDEPGLLKVEARAKRDCEKQRP